MHWLLSSILLSSALILILQPNVLIAEDTASPILQNVLEYRKQLAGLAIVLFVYDYMYQHTPPMKSASTMSASTAPSAPLLSSSEMASSFSGKTK